MSDPNVNDDAATHGEHQQPQDGGTAHDLAVSLLKAKAAAGEDFISNPLSRKQAEAIANELNAKHGTGVKYGLIYKAKNTLASAKANDIKDIVDANLGGKITKPGNLFDNMGEAQKVEDLLGGGSAGQSAPAQQETPGQQPKKDFEPLPIAQVKTIVDVCVDGIADTIGRMTKKDIPAKSLAAAKATYNATLEAYNASLPKWLLLPICLVVTVFVFVLPAASSVKGKKSGPVPDAHDPAPAAQAMADELQRTNDPFYPQ